MLYNHSEIKSKYKSTYQIRKALENKEIYKIETFDHQVLKRFVEIYSDASITCLVQQEGDYRS